MKLYLLLKDALKSIKRVALIRVESNNIIESDLEFLMFELWVAFVKVDNWSVNVYNWSVKVDKWCNSVLMLLLRGDTNNETYLVKISGDGTYQK